MGYAVEMFFDKQSQAKLQSIKDNLKALGLPDDGGRPHLTLSVYDDLDPDASAAMLKDFCATESGFKVFLAFIGTFISKENVIFAAPVMTDELREIHHRFHTRLQILRESAWSLYLPGAWQPHCTLAIDLAEPDFARAFACVRERFQPLEAEITSIGLEAFRPARRLAEYRLR